MSDEIKQPEVEAAPSEVVTPEAVSPETGAQESGAQESGASPTVGAPAESSAGDGSGKLGDIDNSVAAAAAAAHADAELTAAEEAIDLTEPSVAPAGPIEEAADDDEEITLNWYILKVQSNRERTSSEALKRKIAIEGLGHLFGEVIVPTEKVTEFKNGKKKTVERKIWPGYIAVQMHVNDDTWFAIRETSGIGDFTGGEGKPAPMQPHEIAMILPKEEGEQAEDDAPKLNIKFAEGDKVKVKDGNFENFEGEVDSIDQQSGKITVMISIFGRSTPVELEYWQVETL